MFIEIGEIAQLLFFSETENCGGYIRNLGREGGREFVAVGAPFTKI